MLPVRGPSRLVWSDLAHRLHGAEPIHLGLPGKLRSIDAAYLAELHLECFAM